MSEFVGGDGERRGRGERLALNFNWSAMKDLTV